MNKAILLSTLLLLSACGINLKTPPDFGVKVNLDAKGLSENIRAFTNKKVLPVYYKFLKDEPLKKYILEQAKKYDAKCFVPTKKMVEFENHDSSYVFTLHQRCFFEDKKTASVKEMRFEVSGSVDPKSLNYEILYDVDPEFQISDIASEELTKLTEVHPFLEETSIPNRL